MSGRLVEAAEIEAAGGGAAPAWEQEAHPHFAPENRAPISRGESRRVRSVWFFFGPLEPFARQKRWTALLNNG
jgi:hypothetical protein